MVRHTLMTLLILCVFGSCKYMDSIEPASEKIDGDANVRDSIKGEILFKLKDNALVLCGPLKNRWYVIGTTIQLTKQQWEDRSIKPGMDLFDLEGSEIGKTVTAIKLLKADSGNSGYSGLISGYTHMNNIKVESFVEYVIPDYLKGLNSYTLTSFNKLFKRYGFKEVDCFDGYKSFAIYENEIIDPYPGFRIALFFKENNLVAIVHSRNLEIPKTIDIDIAKGYKCLLFLNLNEKNEFIDKLNGFYLQRRLTTPQINRLKGSVIEGAIILGSDLMNSFIVKSEQNYSSELPLKNNPLPKSLLKLLPLLSPVRF